MPTTQQADVLNQIQTFWSPVFDEKMREDTLLPSLVAKDYDGEIKEMGDTVRVSAIDNAVAERKTVGDVGADVYSSRKLSMTHVDIKADQIIEAGFKIESLAMLQSQLNNKEGQIRQKLFEALEREVNAYLYSLVAPSPSAPDHVLSGVTDFNATQMGNIRTLASQAQWGSRERWLLLDPVYFQDLLNATTMTSGDYGAADSPMIGGKFVLNRFGFNILEDNSAGMSQVSPTSAATDLGLAFAPDFVQFVMQKGVTFKLSDLHAQEKRGFLLTAEMLVGSKLGIEGANKHISIYNV